VGKALHFAVFKTAIGPCGVVWSERGLVGVQLPEATLAHTLKRVARRFPDATETTPTPVIQAAIDGIVALLSGEKRDLGEVVLDMDDLPLLNRRVYDVARTIRPGTTLTYGDVARRVGREANPRSVGQALGANPFPIVVPCHRVLAASGGMGGFSAPGGVATKRRMLEIEGVDGVVEEPSLF
jgi:methylated-DNA-[protein]-cysteine S-methyltransferase